MKIQFIAGTGKHELNITADIKHTVREMEGKNGFER